MITHKGHAQVEGSLTAEWKGGRGGLCRFGISMTLQTFTLITATLRSPPLENTADLGPYGPVLHPYIAPLP